MTESPNLSHPRAGQVAIVGAGPLVYLHACGVVGLLEAYYPTVLTTPAVVKELTARRGEGLPGLDVAALPWLTVAEPAAGAGPAGEDGEDPLGRANREVLALAAETEGAVAVVEGRHARRTGMRQGVRCTGTLGLLIMARQSGLIPSVADLLPALKEAGFPFSRKVLTSTLLFAGESARLAEVGRLAR